MLAVGLALLGASLAAGHSPSHPSVAHETGVAPTTTTETVGTRPPFTRPKAGLALKKAQPGVTAHQPTSTTAVTQPAASPTPSAGITVGAKSLVATIPATGAPGSRTPGGPPRLEVPGQWLQAASILPVIAQQPGWVEVRLAQRPNGSTAWVPTSDVSLATDSYHIVIDLGTTHLRLFNDGQEVASFPAGIGVPSAPTPTGSFFVALFAQAPSPGYGQFVIVTSAHSNALSDWEESGDAITAIHGPLRCRRRHRHHWGKSVPWLRSASQRRPGPTAKCARWHPHRYRWLTVALVPKQETQLAHPSCRCDRLRAAQMGGSHPADRRRHSAAARPDLTERLAPYQLTSVAEEAQEWLHDSS